MSHIRILSEHLANRIAAGEVVERPASVVKELVENSLDAGATRITVQVEGAGTRLIRVLDNGEGMDGDDVLLCIERHATSKLSEESRLDAITTLGFRGEAIPSIGSVSRMTIRSRPAEAVMGTRVELRYGSLHQVHEDGCARGTVIEVRHLFGNMPARKKFLKSARTELYHIEEVLRNQALAHPGTAFCLQVEGRTVFDWPAGGDLEHRVREVFRYRDTLLPLAGVRQDDSGPEVDGFLLLPEAVPASGARLRTLVNARPVQDRMIRHAVVDGMQGFLMKGHQPAGVLRLTIAPEEVDVNVHPAKREIRFRRPGEVHAFVRAAVAGAIAAHQEALRSRLFGVPAGGEGREGATGGDPPVTDAPTPSGATSQQPLSAGRQGFAVASSGDETPTPAMDPSGLQVAEPGVPPGRETDDSRGLVLIGQLFQLYLLCEKDDHLVVIDQHAAHERILYGRLRQGYLERAVPRQGLLFPVSVELGPEHARILEERMEEVVALGVQAEHFGDTTWLVKAVPAPLRSLRPDEILLEVLDALGSAGGRDGVVPPAVDSMMASMACKAAVKGGNRLQPEEMLGLLQQMEASGVFSHCPHGRPVVRRFGRREIEKWFHRT
ncbi:DNA mismatch repair endonuclease MutL [Thermodesulfobacteriota bacterium B35]